MKIYINNQHQIKAISVNSTDDNTLMEIEVDDSFLSQYCDTVKCAFCYHQWTDETGNPVLSVYPYKDFAVMESIQKQYEIDQEEKNELLETIVENDYRLSMMELGL